MSVSFEVEVSTRVVGARIEPCRNGSGPDALEVTLEGVRFAGEFSPMTARFEMGFMPVEGLASTVDCTLQGLAGKSRMQSSPFDDDLEVEVLVAGIGSMLADELESRGWAVVRRRGR